MTDRENKIKELLSDIYSFLEEDKNLDLIPKKNQEKEFITVTCSDVWRTNHFELFVDNIEDLRLYCTGIDLSSKENEGGRIIAKFYYTNEISLYFNDDTDAFKLDTEHEISLRAKLVDTKESLKANFFTWLYGISNYESRIVKYERTTIRGNSKKTNRESCKLLY